MYLLTEKLPVVLEVLVPHIATQKKVHQNSVTYIPPTPAYQDEEIEGQEGTRLEETHRSQAEGKGLACQRTERLSVKGRTCGTRIALVAAVTVRCWCLSLDELGNYFNRWDTGYLSWTSWCWTKKISPNSLTTSELKQAVRGSN